MWIEMKKAFFIGSIGIVMLAMLHIGIVHSQQLTNDTQINILEESSTSKKTLKGNVVTAKPVSSPNHLSYNVIANPNDVIHVTIKKMKIDGIYEDILSYAETLSYEGISQEHQHEGAGKYKLVIEDKSNNTTATHTIVVP